MTLEDYRDPGTRDRDPDRGGIGPRGHSVPDRVVRSVVTEEPLDRAAHEAAVRRPEAGAVVSFTGVVRDHDQGRSVRRITYTGHPAAERVLAELAEGVVARTGVAAVAVSHRLGVLPVGEDALVVAVAAAHRAEAFAAAELLVEEIKRRLPVWKCQQFTDGTEAWAACP